MRILILVSALALSGCELMDHYTCAPKYMVELCLQEASTEGHQGLGPHCQTLDAWAKSHHWDVP